MRCCSNSSECASGSVCCYQRSPSNHIEPHGIASCTTRSACAASPDNVVLCGGAPFDCTTVGKVACMTWSPGGYATQLTACQ